MLEHLMSIDFLTHLSKNSKIIKIGANEYRINPCPICGHNDCCTCNEEKKIFNCFSCKKGGSLIDYEMCKNNCDEAAAITMLEEQYRLKKEKN